MKLKNALLTLGAGAMFATPIAASAGTGAAQSVGKVASLSGVGTRTSQAVAKKHKQEGSGGWIIGIGAAAAVVAGVVILADDDGGSSGD